MLKEGKYTFRANYDLGAVVFLRCRDEGMRGMVTRVAFSPAGVSYEVTWGTGGSSWHYGLELSTEFIPVFKTERDA